TVDIGHHEIEKHQRHLFAARGEQKIERGSATRCRHRDESEPRNGGFEQTPLNRIVVDNQYGLSHGYPSREGHCGARTVKTCLRAYRTATGRASCLTGD